ncbi:hypothetical protein HPDFL43_00008930 [Hoeflea phototrophica DFL-43]|jgi:hypothetical protein|uniref:Uncharacterized protein n=1 Tax=Hoeflea phototrophica (strain DSM 17068 / NCIMB 14078 / DFL-43) TaxID=411684 RepID=A0A094YYL8_HOEPD|nr:hypothetical protein HPDFL43_00008930 [Hoeflea phototrophica DFL-43]
MQGKTLSAFWRLTYGEQLVFARGQAPVLAISNRTGSHEKGRTRGPAFFIQYED